MFNTHKNPFFSFKMMYLWANLTYFKCSNSQFKYYVSDGTLCIINFFDDRMVKGALWVPSFLAYNFHPGSSRGSMVSIEAQLQASPITSSPTIANPTLP